MWVYGKYSSDQNIREAILTTKRRTHTGEKVRIKEIIAKQTTISIFIFVALFIIKIIDTPVTNYISGKVKWFLQQDISVNDIMNKVNTLIDGVINGTIWKGQLQKAKTIPPAMRMKERLMLLINFI